MSGDSENDQGDAAFQRHDYPAAILHYDTAIMNAGSDASAALYSKKAEAFLNLGQRTDVIRQCQKALVAPGLTPELKSKIYFRMGLAYGPKEKLADAMEAFKMCEESPEVAEKMAELQLELSKGAGTRQSRDELISEYAQLAEAAQKDRAQWKTSFDGRLFMVEPRHVCAALLCDLETISIDQLRLHAINVGKVLVCRTIAKPVMLDALATLVEDPNGDVVRLVVHNICSSDADLTAVLPVGTYLAIKEPCYIIKSSFASRKSTDAQFETVEVDDDAGYRKLAYDITSVKRAADGMPALSVDDPSDIVYLEQSHPRLKNVQWLTALPASPEFPSNNNGDPQAWQAFTKRGNELFVAGRYKHAVVAYTDAIELKRSVVSEQLADLFANRAVAYLGDDSPLDAMWDCRSALFVQPGHLKGTFRLAKALAHLANYEEAKHVLERSPHTTRPEFQAEISRLNRLIREHKHGEYDLKLLLKEAAASKTPRLEHADYNAGVAVQWISQEKGNGLVALRDFAAGDLIFVDKAFEATYTAECNFSIQLKVGRENVSFSPLEMSLEKKVRNKGVSRLLRRISLNRQFAEVLDG